MLLYPLYSDEDGYGRETSLAIQPSRERERKEKDFRFGKVSHFVTALPDHDTAASSEFELPSSPELAASHRTLIPDHLCLTSCSNGDFHWLESLRCTTLLNMTRLSKHVQPTAILPKICDVDALYCTPKRCSN